MSGDTATLRHQRCATIGRALCRAREELRIAWDEAYTDLNEPERDDELSNFCRDTIAKIQPLMLKAHEAMVRNRNAALGLSLTPVHHADLGDIDRSLCGRDGGRLALIGNGLKANCDACLAIAKRPWVLAVLKEAPGSPGSTCPRCKEL